MKSAFAISVCCLSLSFAVAAPDTGAAPRISVFAKFVRMTAAERGISLEAAADRLYDLGVRGYDCGPDEDDLEALAKTKLRPINFYYFPDWFGRGLQDWNTYYSDRTKPADCIALAKRYRIPRIMVVPPSFTDGRDNAAEFGKILANMKDFVALAKKNGLAVTVEDYGGAGNCCSYAKYLKRLLDEIPDLQFALDSGNLLFAGRGEDILEMMAFAKGRIGHVHLKDQTADGRSYTSLGLGCVPNEKIVRAMKAAGYAGWYTLENPVGDTYADTLRQTTVLRNWLGCPFVPVPSAAAETRYLANAGDDKADGKTPATAWRTLEKLNSDLPPGATALLKRGDVFYGGVRLKAGTGPAQRTTLGAYGKGPKPVISATKNIKSDPTVWEDYSHNFWRVDLRNPTNFTGIVTEDCNPGFLLVDGAVKAWKRYCIGDLVSPWDFCGEDGWLYVHAEANPATVAKEIRVALRVPAVVFASHAAVSDIAVCATGSHGMFGGWDGERICEDIRISDCDFENIGGSELPNYKSRGRIFHIRYGNGVEFGSNCRDAIVERCTFKGVYDVAFTMQGSPTKTSWRDIHVRGCTMTDCTQAFEIWCKGAPKGHGFERCSFTGNSTLRVGGGWGPVVRPMRACATPLLVYGMDTDTVDIDVSGNVFEDAPRGLVYKSGGLDQMPKGYRIHDNVCRKIGGK